MKKLPAIRMFVRAATCLLISATSYLFIYLPVVNDAKQWDDTRTAIGSWVTTEVETGRVVDVETEYNLSKEDLLPMQIGILAITWSSGAAAVVFAVLGAFAIWRPPTP